MLSVALRKGLFVALAASLMLTPAASARIYGTNPLNISVSPDGQAANGASGGPAISGDNRKARLAAFHSDASNLVAGDGNGVRDVFVWRRPRGSLGLRLNRAGAGSLSRASVSGNGTPANGASQNPSLDGSIKKAPRCVAFESLATNLSSHDATPDSDIYVRDLRRHKTKLISGAATEQATQPAISGDCRRVAFEAGGYVYLASTRTGRAKRFRAGANPDFSLDGRAIVWQSGSKIKLRRNGRTVTVGSGSDGLVSDAANRQRGVAYNHNGRATLAVVSRGGRVRRRAITGYASRVAGISAFAPQRGIITFIAGSGLYYLNRRTGNTDDLAHAASTISEATASARSNFAAFTAAGGGGFVDPSNGRTQNVYFKHLVDGDRL